MLVGCVVDDEIEKDLEASLVAAFDDGIDLLELAVLVIWSLVVRDVCIGGE